MAGRMAMQRVATGSQCRVTSRAVVLPNASLFGNKAAFFGRAFSQVQQGCTRCLSRRTFHTSAVAAVDAPAKAILTSKGKTVRCRFAPSPTGNLHVGGARTALFNWLYANNTGGKMILRIEDTDAARSTKESEDAVLRDLAWLGIKYDEGPDVGGDYGPYRQSERTDIYKSYVDQLVEKNLAYACFCTDEELAAMKADAAAKSLPPVYRGKWARASAEEVAEAKAAGIPYCYRFRAPKDQSVTINDLVRGEVTFQTNAVGDFVILRSNGLPTYNFCVAIDDALMAITHVLRAEEHLPNTLRQVLVYQALGFETPDFGHVSLILAPDKSKLSKRHGATSVGEFREQGFLPEAMINYLSLLGWNDGTEQEIFSMEDLFEKFSMDRITKSAAVFDKEKLVWMNSQHLRALPEERLIALMSERLVASGLLAKADSPFVRGTLALVKSSLELAVDGERELRRLLTYPLLDTVASEAAAEVLADNFKEVADAVLLAYDNGELAEALASGHDGFKNFAKKLGKEQKRKGKRLFMPLRICFTGSMQGPDVGSLLEVLQLEQDDVAEAGAYVPLPARMEALRQWPATSQ